MTDKQIIIDDVDVSKCNYFNNTDKSYCEECCSEFGCAICNDRPNCYYKQLARKEQECEELKHEVELMMDCASCKVDEYKQTLTEIKEIAKVEIECKTYEIENDCFNETRCKALNEHIGFIKQILQKINECEAKYEN